MVATIRHLLDPILPLLRSRRRRLDVIRCSGGRWRRGPTRGRTTRHRDTEAIWSTDDVPVRDGPLDLVWAPRPSEPDTPMSPAGQGLPFDEPVTASPVDATSEERNLRSKLLIGAVALVAVAIVVGSLVRSGDTDEQAAPVASDETGSTIDVATTTPTTMARLPSTTLASGGAQADLEISTEPIDVELPPPVAAIQTPTEIVMLTDRRSRAHPLVAVGSGSIGCPGRHRRHRRLDVRRWQCRGRARRGSDPARRWPRRRGRSPNGPTDRCQLGRVRS